MRHASAALLCLVYLALAPLCVSHFGHASTHERGAHTHHATESAPLPLSYHAAMYQSFTTAPIAASLAFFCLLLALVTGTMGVRLPRLRVLHAAVPDRSAERPPAALLQRLSLFTHAPPRYA